MNKNSSSSNLTSDEWSLINNIKDAYDLSTLDCDTTHINNYSLIDSTLKDFLNDEQQMFKKDQIILIKCNITHLIHIHHVLKDNFVEGAKLGIYMSKWINPDFHRQMSKTRHSLDFFIQYPMALKIALVTFMFISNLSRLPYNQLSIQLIDKNLINQHQNFFTTLLWKYLNVIYKEKDAIRAIELIIFQFLRYQLLMSEMDNIILNQFNPDQFHPLIRSVLRLP
ncbi:unnamed protein product [Rotaria sp. Silwood1]|nr:unnamed protein product [Rotaria sp. Silwood1]